MAERSARNEWAQIFSALASEPRLRIVEHVMKGPIRCKDMLDQLGLSQPAVSYHLSKLERAGILRKEKNGVRNCYRVGEDLVEVLRRCMKEDGSWNTL